MRSPRRDLLNYAQFLKASGFLFAEGDQTIEEIAPSEPPPALAVKQPAQTAASAPTPLKPAPAAAPKSPPAPPSPSRSVVVPVGPPPSSPRPWGPILSEAERVIRVAEARKEAEACRACALGGTRTQAVYSSGGVMSRIMFIGEAPGADEDASGIPFVGRAGQLLTKMIEAIGFNREEVYVCNTLKCRPPENRPPQPPEKAACRHFLLDQIDWIRPQIIVTLGAHATGVVTGENGSLGPLRRRWHTYGGIPLMVTYHPSFLLRSPGYKPQAWEDMKMLHAKYCDLNPSDPRKIWAKE